MNLWSEMWSWFGDLPVWARVLVLGIFLYCFLPYCLPVAYLFGGLA